MGGVLSVRLIVHKWDDSAMHNVQMAVYFCIPIPISIPPSSQIPLPRASTLHHPPPKILHPIKPPPNADAITKFQIRLPPKVSINNSTAQMTKSDPTRPYPILVSHKKLSWRSAEMASLRLAATAILPVVNKRGVGNSSKGIVAGLAEAVQYYRLWEIFDEDCGDTGCTYGGIEDVFSVGRWVRSRGLGAYDR